MGNQSTSYRGVFLSANGEPNVSQAVVLQDLRRFCFAEKRTFQRDKDGRIDPVASALMEGRREVWIRINAFLHLTDEQLARLEREETNQSQNALKDAERGNAA